MESTKPKRIFNAQVQEPRMNSFATCSELDCSGVYFDRSYFQWRRSDVHDHICTQVKKKNAYFQYTVEIYMGEEKEIRKTSFYFFLQISI